MAIFYFARRMRVANEPPRTPEKVLKVCCDFSLYERKKKACSAKPRTLAPCLMSDQIPSEQFNAGSFYGRLHVSVAKHANGPAGHGQNNDIDYS